jgi:hypothetical protein
MILTIDQSNQVIPAFKIIQNSKEKQIKLNLLSEVAIAHKVFDISPKEAKAPIKKTIKTKIRRLD